MARHILEDLDFIGFLYLHKMYNCFNFNYFIHFNVDAQFVQNNLQNDQIYYKVYALKLLL